jgi:hypothetical protein
MPSILATEAFSKSVVLYASLRKARTKRVDRNHIRMGFRVRILREVSIRLSIFSILSDKTKGCRKKS